MGLILTDLDNCISDDGWRLGFIDYKDQNILGRYHNYHSLAPFDKIANRDIVDQVEHDIIIVTARPQLYRAATKEWLRRNGVAVKGLLMRELSHVAPSAELKALMVQAVLDWSKLPIESIACAYDDREDVVKMYQSLGIKAELRYIHKNDGRKM